ncbi:MAG: hypothetical protein ABL901_05355 [Hyphomicrobiaceae bacterium]
MLIARIVVGMAVLATLLFNGSYAYTRGDGQFEKLGLILLAVIIDLSKTSFLAAAAHLRANRHILAAVVLFVLWWPAIALSSWASFSYISTNRAATAADKAAGSDARDRAQRRYDLAKRKVELVTADSAYVSSAGCAKPKGAVATKFCEGVSEATEELAAAEAALTKAPPGRADPETLLLAQQTGVQQGTVEFMITVVPALFLELVASLGFYAVTRSLPTASAKPASAPVDALPTAEVVRDGAATKTPPEALAVAPATADAPKTARRLAPATPLAR